MSLTVFLALCVLGLDFMTYVLFQWIYGEKRRGFARQIAARKRARKNQSRFVVPGATNIVTLHASRPSQVSLTSRHAFAKWPTGVPSGASIARSDSRPEAPKPGSAPRPKRVPNVILPA
jgi:hypothetical protein